MKVKTVIISVVVSASLVAGVGYGAYYAIRGKATPVEVVPVANVNQYYGWGDEDGNTVYGTITSQVAQTVSLNQDYQVADIYVQEGQKVKEGEALFSYDMTLPELELEMAKLNLQTQELTMVRLEKDLEKLKKSKVVSASLQMDSPVFTTAADTAVPEEIVEETKSGEENTSEEGQTEAETDDGNSTSEGNGLSVEDVEQVQDPNLAGEDSTTAIQNSVNSFEQLVNAIDTLYRAYGDSLTASNLRDPMTTVIDYYRKNLADEQRSEETGNDGQTYVVRSYEPKDEVKQALSREELAKLRDMADEMNRYHVVYVELLIRELNPDNPQELKAQVREAQQEYDRIETYLQGRVMNLDRLEQMKKKLEDETDTPETNESETEIGQE